MPLREELERQGAFFFRWRSYWPIITVVLFLIAFKNYRYPGNSHLMDRILELVCFSISLSGLALRAYATSCAPRGTSGRNTKQQAASCLNTTGLYSVTRHPLYLANFLIWTGIFISMRSFWLSLVSVLAYWIYYERIMFAEEEFLRREFGDVFLKWAEKTPVFFPNFKNWKPSELHFSWRNALRREYSGFFAIIAVFTLLDLVEDLVVERRLLLDPLWAILFIFGLVVYLVLMTLKKKTNLLTVSGR